VDRPDDTSCGRTAIRTVRFRSGSRAYGVSLIVALLLLWELSARSGWIVSDYWPPVSHILAAAVAQLAGGEILVSLAATLRRAAIGYVAASVAGIALGIVLARNRAAIRPAAADRNRSSHADAGGDPAADSFSRRR